MPQEESAADSCLLEDNPEFALDELGGCLLEDNPAFDDGGGCLLETNPVEGDLGCLLEDNPVGCEEADDACVLEENGPAYSESEAGEGYSSSDCDDEREIPFSAAALEELEAEELEVKLARRGDEPMGLVLDPDNGVVAVRPGTPAASCREILAGDELVAINGHACTASGGAAELLRSLPQPRRGLYTLRLRRAVAAGRSVPGGAQVEAQLAAQRAALEPPPSDGRGGGAGAHNPMPDMAECRREAERGALDGQTERQLQRLWKNQARQPLSKRLATAEMMRAEGNDHFTAGRFKEALDEYGYALAMFKYEIANVARDQEAAELGDLGRGLGSEDLRKINKARVPCLLNSAAAKLKLAAAAAGEEEAPPGAPPPTPGLQPVARGDASKAHLVSALEDLSETLKSGPAAQVRAKAHFRAAQAHAGLENWREAWSAASLARELQPGSAEVKEVQLKVQREMRLLQRSERESKRQGAFGTGTNRNLLDRDERKEFQARLGLAQKLLPAAGGDDAARQRRNEAEGLVEKAAASGWSQLSPAEQAGFEELWRTALPSLPAQEVRRGREEGVFPPRDQERVFGANLPLALTGRPLEGPLGWLSPPQLERARGLATEIFQRGAEQLDGEQRRFAEGTGLLAPSDARNPWHSAPLGSGGAVLLLCPARQHLWPFPPPSLRVQAATLGGEMGAAALADARAGAAASELGAGDVGVLASNVAAWRDALAAGWEWVCVLEDDAAYSGGGPPLLLASLLPLVAASATAAQRDWSLLSLSLPAGADGHPIDGTGWRRVAPPQTALAWVYKASLLRTLLDAHDKGGVGRMPLARWVSEVLAQRGLLGRVLAPAEPLVAARKVPSVRQAQGT